MTQETQELFDKFTAVVRELADLAGEIAQVEEAKAEAVEMAVEAGAIRETVEIIDMEDVPLQYYPGNTNRVKIKAAGDLG